MFNGKKYIKLYSIWHFVIWILRYNHLNLLESHTLSHMSLYSREERVHTVYNKMKYFVAMDQKDSSEDSQLVNVFLRKLIISLVRRSIWKWK